MSHSVYILQSERNGRYYTGYSADPMRRLEQHNAGKVKATRNLKPWRLVYVEKCDDSTVARQREHYIKSMKSRVYIEKLLESDSGG